MLRIRGPLLHRYFFYYYSQFPLFGCIYFLYRCDVDVVGSWLMRIMDGNLSRIIFWGPKTTRVVVLNGVRGCDVKGRFNFKRDCTLLTLSVILHLALQLVK